MRVDRGPGWLFVCEALAAAGAVAHVAEPVESSALWGKKRRAKTDRVHARWLRTLLWEGRHRFVVSARKLEVAARFGCAGANGECRADVGIDAADGGEGRVRVARVHRLASVSPLGSLDFYDAELSAHHEHFRGSYGINPGDHVVDIGCGTGLTTREAARAALPGRVVGVDVSERLLERARRLSVVERLDNVRYELGDAQVHRFDHASFDVAISRFGTMFFSDPLAAFANIAATLRSQARLVLLVWQQREHNEWARLIDAVLGEAARPPQPGADAFSLGDAEATERILAGAGFDGIRFQDVHEPVLYGHDLDAALAVVRGFQETSAALASLSADEAIRTVERLREMLAAHYSDERGVALDSRSWLITATRRP